jgi:hypothetical protein
MRCVRSRYEPFRLTENWFNQLMTAHAMLGIEHLFHAGVERCLLHTSAIAAGLTARW